MKSGKKKTNDILSWQLIQTIWGKVGRNWVFMYCYNIYNDNPIKFLSFVGKSHNKFGLRQTDICNCKARKKEKEFQFEK